MEAGYSRKKVQRISLSSETLYGPTLIYVTSTPDMRHMIHKDFEIPAAKKPFSQLWTNRFQMHKIAESTLVTRGHFMLTAARLSEVRNW